MAHAMNWTRWLGALMRHKLHNVWNNHVMQAFTWTNALGASELLLGTALVIVLIVSLGRLGSAPRSGTRSRYLAMALICGLTLAWMAVATTPTFSFVWSIVGVGTTWVVDARKRRNELLGKMNRALYTLNEYRRDFDGMHDAFNDNKNRLESRISAPVPLWTQFGVTPKVMSNVDLDIGALVVLLEPQYENKRGSDVFAKILTARTRHREFAELLRLYADTSDVIVEQLRASSITQALDTSTVVTAADVLDNHLKSRLTQHVDMIWQGCGPPLNVKGKEFSGAATIVEDAYKELERFMDDVLGDVSLFGWN